MRPESAMYARDFQLFLDHSTEKFDLYRVLRRIIGENHPESLLDIGAGNGSLAISLSQLVKTYVAVEPNNVFAAKLREAKLTVYECEFPAEVPGRYDMVLLSHVISHNPVFWAPMVDAAWDYVKENGELIIIIFRNGDDDWTRLLAEIGQDKRDIFQQSFYLLVECLAKRGHVHIQGTTSYVETNTADRMFRTLSFVAGGGKEEQTAQFTAHESKVKAILNQNYRVNLFYRFPFNHTIIRAKKSI